MTADGFRLLPLCATAVAVVCALAVVHVGRRRRRELSSCSSGGRGVTSLAIHGTGAAVSAVCLLFMAAAVL